MLIKKNIMLLLLMNIFFMGSGNMFSQHSQKLSDAETKINSGEYDEANKVLSNINSSSLSIPEKALYNYLQAQYLESTNAEHKALKYYIESKKLYKLADSIDKAMEINLTIAFLLNAQNNYSSDYSQYINEYMAYARKTNDPLKLARGYGNLAMLKAGDEKYNEALIFYKKALSLSKTANNKNVQSALNNNLAALYCEKLNKPDSALYYLQNDLTNIKESGNIPYDLFHNYINQAAANYRLNKYDLALSFLKKADSLHLNESILKSKEMIYANMHIYYKAKGDYPNAYKYLRLNKKFADSINVFQQNIAINDIETKYKTKETALKNQILTGKVKNKDILIYTFIGLLTASLAIGFLIIKNARRREKISKQDKLIEQQKLDKALKDYELHSIDLMLEGQEKERQRIANDLHDNLGSMLATLKINFENLKLRKNEIRDDENKLYERTDELIEEAYQKVRRLAHAKNAGVFASEGLIPAIKKLAEKISIPNKLKIDVISFGFDERLENTLEIAIFRAVQELSTNIIKHSEATEATIHLTHHEDNINIIIEDNGVGFDSSAINMTDGMGLQTIRKKIEQLNGTFIIDATPDKGTTIIIDIPV